MGEGGAVLLELANINKSFGDVQAIADLDLEIKCIAEQTGSSD